MSKEIMKERGKCDGEISLFTLNVRNLHIHLDERSYINSSYNSAADDDEISNGTEAQMNGSDEGCADCCGCCDEDEKCSKDLDTAEVIKEVSAETGLPEEIIKKVLNKQAELLMKRLFDED